MSTSATSKLVWLKRILLSLLAVILLASAFVYWTFRGSLPQLQGTIVNSNLSSPVKVERDRQGLVTITSSSRVDSAFAMGYVHAQERFFQMDLLRRRGAGELSELFGRRALGVDKSARLHRFRARAKQFIKNFPKSQKQIFEHYAMGVNAGLAALNSKPFEYHLLTLEPTKWTVEDSLLASYAMYFSLQSDNGNQEWEQHLLYSTLPSTLTKFLFPLRSLWDAPIQPEASKGPWIQSKLPAISPLLPQSSEPQSSANQSANKLESNLQHQESSQVGLICSNNWAVGGGLTKTGSAMMANDMHLGIRVPNTWFRMRLKNPDGSLDVNGVSLPGGPLIVAGSNTYVAWGFTNSYGDWGDLVELNINPDNPSQYGTKNGYADFVIHSEEIKIKGEDSYLLNVRDTQWGPVVSGPSQQLMAYKWVAHYPQGMNAGLLQMENMKSVDQALSIVDSIGMPAQNAMLADRYGNIAWTIFGAIPNRHYSNKTNSDGEQVVLQNYTLPADWSNGDYGWDGWLKAAQYPRLKNPQNSRLWTANSRVVSGENLAKVGEGHYALGARAQQIRDDLMALKYPIKEQQLLDIQLDDRAIFLTRWQKLMLDSVTHSSDQKLKMFIQPLQDWGARAAVDSIGYRLVKAFRLSVARKLFAAITKPCQQKYSQCNYYQATHLWEEPLWSLVTAKNPDWLPAGYQDWQQFFDAIMQQNFAPLLEGSQTLESFTWGAKNQIHISHPLSAAVPGLAALTDMPIQSYSGDRDMPKAATSRFGASERMVISPSHEDQAILHMPTSQSGHPLSPYYGLGHEDWVKGTATPLLPAKTKWVLYLNPKE